MKTTLPFDPSRPPPPVVGPRSVVVKPPSDVVVPTVDELGVVEHGGLLPKVLASSEGCYEALRIAGGSELVITGPSTLVIKEVVLADGAELTIDNLDGAVSLFVVDSMELARGSIVRVTNEDPAQLTLQFAAGASPVELFADASFHGMVYGPETTLTIEQPFEIFGVLVGGTLKIGAGVRVHFDSGIAGDSGALLLPRLLSWEITEVPPAVRSRHMNPLELLAVDPSELESPVDSQASYSWKLTLDYSTKTEGGLSYEGPIENFTHKGVKAYLSFNLTEPDLPTAGSWRLYLRYDPVGHKKGIPAVEWEGNMEDFQPTLHNIRHVHEQHVTPPAELLDKGYQTTTWTCGKAGNQTGNSQGENNQ